MSRGSGNLKKRGEGGESCGNTHTRNRARVISHSFEIIVADANDQDSPLAKPILVALWYREVRETEGRSGRI